MRVFGEPEPSLFRALLRNPRAIIEHFLWNVRLIPSGLQVLLFNSSSGSVSPDYIPVNSGSTAAMALSFCLLIIICAGSVVIYRDRDYWWEHWMKQRIWGWAAMVCIACTVLGVMVMQRPRPSYMFALGVSLMAMTGMSIYVIVHRWPHWKALAPVFPLSVVVLILLTPTYMGGSTASPDLTRPWRGPDRPLLALYRRLSPVGGLLDARRALVTPGWQSEICNYLRGGENYGCRGLSYWDLRHLMKAGLSWGDVLDQHGAELFYAEEVMLGDSWVQEFVSNPHSSGWETLVWQDIPGQRWALLRKTRPRQHQ